MIANAGATLARSIEETTDRDIDRLLDVNMRAVIYLAQAAHGSLRQASGSLVVVASKTGIVAQADSPVYRASEGATVQLARGLAIDWAAEGIRVNALCSGSSRRRCSRASSASCPTLHSPMTSLLLGPGRRAGYHRSVSRARGRLL